ncbi:MAG: hypothetical protein F6J97_13400 [Leptolyngbya sp. SIO4C1]|nr:hypothetical protein [Leptolyngbya sp. SIO4C1]
MELTKVKLWLNIQAESKFIARNENTVRRIVETVYFADLELRPEDIGGWEYELTFRHTNRADLEDQITNLLNKISSSADSYDCFIEADVLEPEDLRV